MTDEKKNVQTGHRISLDGRERLTVTGVLEVISFDEENVISDTELGMLAVRGDGLHISKLNLDDGIFQIDGYIQSMEYSDESGFGKNKTSFFGKIFK